MDARDDVERARQRSLEASATAARIASELFQPGDGYGDPQALIQDQHRLESARAEAERLFREYHELDRRVIGGMRSTLIPEAADTMSKERVNCPAPSRMRNRNR